MKTKILLAKQYLLMLWFDCLQISINPLLLKKNKADWKLLRQKSKAFHKLLKIMLK